MVDMIQPTSEADLLTRNVDGRAIPVGAEERARSSTDKGRDFVHETLAFMELSVLENRSNLPYRLLVIT